MGWEVSSSRALLFSNWIRSVIVILVTTTLGLGLRLTTTIAMGA